MARVTTSTRFRSDSDAAYREILALIENNMAACGLVRTSDTGQINVATAVRVTNTVIGYSVWRFDDALQSVAPIFIKLSHRIGSSINNVTCVWEVGTGSNGAGSLTGTTLTLGTRGAVFTSTLDTLFTSYFTHSNGMFGLAPGVEYTNTYNVPYCCIIQRTVDNNGSPTAEGVVMTNGGQTNGLASVGLLRFVAPVIATVSSASYQTFLPYNLSDTRVGLDPQVFMHWTALPKMKPLVASATYLNTEIALGTQFSLALVGVTPRNYLGVGINFGQSASGSPQMALAMLWED